MDPDAIEVPRWVMPEHRSSYRSLAARDGEEAAAAWARIAKRTGNAKLPPARATKIPLKTRPAAVPLRRRAPPIPRQAPIAADAELKARASAPSNERPAPAPVAGELETAAEPPAGVDIFELRASHCRFPIFGAGIETRYCGDAVECGSYCGRHATITYDRSRRALLKTKRTLAALAKL